MSKRTDLTPGQGSLMVAEYAKDVLAQDGRMYPNNAPPHLDDLYASNDLDDTLMAMFPSAEAIAKLFYITRELTAGYFDVNRKSSATRMNWKKELEIVGQDIPRIDFRDGVPVVLVEEAGENLIEFPVTFSDSYWTKTGATIDDNSGNGYPSPHSDYPTSAYKLVESVGSVSPNLVHTSISITSGANYTDSYYVKYNGRQYFKIRFELAGFGGNYYVSFDVQNGALDAKDVGIVDCGIEPAANGYYRVWASCEATATSGRTRIYMNDKSGASEIGSYTGNGTSGIYIFGAQLEQASEASSLMYFGDENQTTSRMADLITLDLHTDLTRLIEKRDGVVRYPLDIFPIYQMPVGRIDWILGRLGDKDAMGVTLAYLQDVADDGGSYEQRGVECMIAFWDYTGMTEFEASDSYFAPLGYKVGKAYGQKKLGVFDLTVARSTQANRRNENDMLQLMAVDFPRIDFQSQNLPEETLGCAGLLNEYAGENLITYPVSFSNSYWTKSGATIEGDPSTAGSELVTDGNPFVAGSWTLGTGVTVISGKLDYNGVLNNAFAFQSAIELGNFYMVTFEISNYSSGGIRINVGGSSSTPVASADGTHTYYIIAGGSVTNVYIQANGASTTLTVDNVSVKEVTGYQSPSVDYPTSAYKLVESSDAATAHYINKNTVSTSTSTISLSCFVKAGERNWVRVVTNSTANSQGIYFNCSTGTFGTIGTSVITYGSTALSNGWYRIWFTILGNGTAKYRINLADADNSITYDGDGVSGIYIFGAQLEESDKSTSFMYFGTENVKIERAPDDIHLTLDPGVNSITETIDGVEVTPVVVYPEYYPTKGRIQKIITSRTATGPTADLYKYLEDTTILGGTYTESSARCLLDEMNANYSSYANSTLYLKPVVKDTGVVYSQVPADRSGDFTHLRDDDTNCATFINEKGLIETANVNVPRFDNGDGCPVLLLEDAATNLITYPVTFSNSYWTLSGVTLVSGQASPHSDYPTSAYKLVESAVDAQHKVESVIIAPTVSVGYNASIYAKAGERNWINIIIYETGGLGGRQVYFDLANGIIGAETNATGKIEALAGGWFKCSVQVTVGASATTIKQQIRLADGDGGFSYQGDGTSGIYIFGAQLEESDHASSFIYNGTEGSTATRAADKCTNATYSGDSESGVLFVEMESFVNTNEANRVISLSDETSDNLIYLRFSTNENMIQFVLKAGGAASTTITYNLGDITLSTKYAVRWDESGNMSLWRNGISVITGVGDVFLADTFTKVNFGAYNKSSNFYGKVIQLQTLPYLSDPEIEELTT